MWCIIVDKSIKMAKEALEVDDIDVYLWSDSKIVLAWINSCSKKYKKFVSSRLEKIHKLENVTWCHVPGEMNPADCGSRGIFASELVNYRLWWHGPQFLRETIDFMPSQNTFETDNEKKLHMLLATSETKTHSILPNVSSWTRMRRVIVYVLRFAGYAQRKQNIKKKGSPITAEEIDKATVAIVRIAQNEHYKKELSDLRKNKRIEKKSELLKLNVFLDKNELLRVGGRIKNKDMPFDMRHPILIPKKKSEIAKLLIRYVHADDFHTGP